MEQGKAVRAPRQARSIQTKEKILDTAYKIFCEKGYYNTSTNEIAKVAGVSIGSLYSYFADKDTIFLEILERYHQEFISANERMKLSLETVRPDFKGWLTELFESLIRVHEIGKELNHEIKLLCETNPQVAAIQAQYMEESRKIAYDCMQMVREEIGYDDIEAAAIVAFDIMSTIVDRIVFGKDEIGRDRILRAGVEALHRFLVNPQA